MSHRYTQSELEDRYRSSGREVAYHTQRVSDKSSYLDNVRNGDRSHRTVRKAERGYAIASERLDDKRYDHDRDRDALSRYQGDRAVAGRAMTGTITHPSGRSSYIPREIGDMIGRAAYR